MTPARREAMAIAMALVPGLMPRNRLFVFYTNAEAKSARRRASALRGFATQLLAGAEDVRLVRRGDGFVLAYRMAAVHASRRATLSPAEAACIGYLVEKGGGSSIAGAPDRTVLETALSFLDGRRTLSDLEASS